MNQTILFTPVGGTDPISSTNCKDGSMLHICRFYKPNKVIMYMSAYGHFPRPSGPRSPARQGHIKRPVLRLAEPSFLRPANQCC